MLPNDMQLTPDEEAAITAMTSRNIKIPDTATVNGTVRRWTEVVVVEGAELKEGPSTKGATHHVFILKTKVVPGGSDANVGRWVTDFIRVNFSLIKGNAAAAGTNSPASELTMSSMNLKKLKQLAVVAGLDLSTGLTADILNALFPSDGSASLLAGTKLAISMSQNSLKLGPSGEPNQNIDNFLKLGA